MVPKSLFVAAQILVLWCAGVAHGNESSRPIADSVIFQHAGNMGFVSAGLSWQTGAHLEVHLLAGYAPESLEGIDIYVAGAKANYLFNPLVSNEQTTTRVYTGLAFIYYFGNRYSTRDYPRGYYTYPSYQWHLMPYLGIKLTSNDPAQRGVSLYTEIGVIDAYLIHFYNNHQTLEWDQAINLSLGVSIPLH